jgi:outer membrane protein assembly factor BamB
MKRQDILQVLTIAILLISIVSETTVAQPDNQPPAQNIPTQDYSIYSRQDITPHHRHALRTGSDTNQNTTTTAKQYNDNSKEDTENGLMNAPWPMYCHDLHHTGNSQYNTSNNPQNAIIWSFNNTYLGALLSSPAIGASGIIYLGGFDLIALYPDGTIQWEYPLYGWGMSCPALDANGTIYMASAFSDHNYLYAITPNGTQKWRYYTGNDIYSSPAIGPDGTIYFGNGYNIIAVNPNGTLHWTYPTGNYVYSSPAIGDDGTIYCGSIDTYLYALNPNGTLKWRYKTNDWIRVSPAIATDGTIYIVSLDSYLYALQPNGTMKWRTSVGGGTSPTIGPDGTIYAGWNRLYAINPTNGSVKWVIDAGGDIEAGTPAISHEGIIYYGTSYEGGNIYAISPNGTKVWQAYVGDCESALAIGPNGTVYIGANDAMANGHLYAFGRGPLRAEANGPYEGAKYQAITFTGTPFGGVPPYTYHWTFGDGQSSTQQNPSHSYLFAGTYHATFTVTDSTGNQSTDNVTVTVNYPPPWIILLKPRRAIYENNRYIFPHIHPVIYGPITIRTLVIEPAPLGIVRIDHVDICIRGDIVQTFTHPPYQWTWTPLYNDTNSEIEIYAYDTVGHYSLKTIQVETHV